MMTKEHVREKLAIIEQRIEKAMREHDPTSMQQIAELEGMAAERCYLRSRLAFEERDAQTWRRMEAQARQNQTKASKELWAERLRELEAQRAQERDLAEQFAEVAATHH